MNQTLETLEEFSTKLDKAYDFMSGNGKKNGRSKR